MHCQADPVPDDITRTQWERVDEVIERHRHEPGSLIPVLTEVQGITGYLPEAVQRRIAAGLALPLSQVFGVVTFYSYFTMRPRGRHVIRVCMGTACHVRGAQGNLDRFASLLGIEPGGCTADRQYSLEIIRCLGACGLAPVVTVDERPHRRVRRVRIPEILRSHATPDGVEGGRA